GLAGCGKIAQLTGAIEAMLFEQVFRLKNGLSPSSIQTLVQAVDCLDRLFASGNGGSAASSCKAKVLLVDDDAVCNMANEVALKRANYEAASATDGSSALMLLNDDPFDLILLDINMPVMNGVEVCQKLRAIPHHKNTPVIFVTLYDDFQNRAQSQQSGGDDFISKPISPFELIVKATVFLLSANKPQAAEEPPRKKSPKPQSGAPSKPANGGNPAGQPKADGRSKKVNTFQATVNEKLKYLKEALAEETRQREAVEQQAAEN